MKCVTVCEVCRIQTLKEEQMAKLKRQHQDREYLNNQSYLIISELVNLFSWIKKKYWFLEKFIHHALILFISPSTHSHHSISTQLHVGVKTRKERAELDGWGDGSGRVGGGRTVIKTHCRKFSAGSLGVGPFLDCVRFKPLKKKKSNSSSQLGVGTCAPLPPLWLDFACFAQALCLGVSQPLGSFFPPFFQSSITFGSYSYFCPISSNDSWA